MAGCIGWGTRLIEENAAAHALRPRLSRVGTALAQWLAEQRVAIEREAARAAGPLDPASPEAEALRRFRSFALLALARGAASPSLEGLRASLRRSARAIDAWIEAAALLAGPDAQAVRDALAVLRVRFVAALGASAPQRAESGAHAPSARRFVPSAIDRVADVFLAADSESGAIVDANPAACALLGLARPELLARTLDSLAAPADRAGWMLLLDAAAEGTDVQRAELALLDATGAAARLDVRVTRLRARGRTLALLVARA
jgi:PAS domain S-box-containing protein